MSHEPSHQSHAAAWLLLVLLVVPLLYLLSVPPVVHYFVEMAPSPRLGVSRFQDPEPVWVKRYRYPYDQLLLRTPLKAPMRAYAEWWTGVFYPPVRSF